MQLARYEAARKALAAAHRVDEVKTIRDKAEAMAAYARQAKDTQLVEYATEIKVRAERRCGELLARAKQDGQRHSGRGDQKSESKPATPKLSDIGLTKDQSSRYQQLAAMPEKHFETAVATAKSTAGEVTTAFMLKQAKRHRRATPSRKREAPKPTASMKSLRRALMEMLNAVAEELAARGLSAEQAAAQFLSEVDTDIGPEDPAMVALHMFGLIYSKAKGVQS